MTETSSALGDLRKLLLPLAENVTDPFWVKDREGRFVLVNQAALRHLGATSEKDVLGRTDFDFSSDELASQYRADDERVLESGQPLVDKEMLSPDAAGVNHRFSMTKVPTRDTSGTIVGLVGIARDITASRGVETERARLVEEQGALRRVATLVARGVHADELYAAVTQEASRVLHTEAVGMLRLESDESATLVAQSDTPWEPPPLGTRLTLEGDNVFAEVLRTGRAARVDDWANSSGSVVAMADVLGVRSTVATPIVVEGRLWGLMIAATSGSEPLHRDTESRLGQFTELVATAIANAAAHGDVQLLADEQAALRRIATLVAQGLPPEAISRAVAEEAGLLFDADLTVLGRFDEGSAVATGSWSASGEIIPEGTRSALGGENVLSQVAETRQPARLDSYDNATGEAAEIARRFGWRSSIAAPVVTEGSVWGVMLVASTREAPFPAGAEQRLAAFTELLATAVSNAQAGDRLRRLADEQAALRRVAMYVAEGASSSALCTLVVEEVAQALEVPSAWLIRYEPERMASVVASVNAAGFPIGDHWPLEGSSVSASVFDTGGPARIDDYSAQPGQIAAQTREFGITSAVGVPITLDGATWGAVCVATNGAEPLPADLEARLSRFTDLVATAISNAEAHDEVRGLLDEQAALRRVATLVAESAPPHDVFTAVCDDVARLFGLERIEMVRYAADGWGTVVAASGDHPFVAGSRWNADDPSVLREVLRTGGPARIDDYSSLGGAIAEEAHRAGFRSAIGAPIVVDGDVWGTIIAISTEPEPIPEGTEHKLSQFTELVASAISNLQARDDLRSLAEEQAALRRVATLVAEGTDAETLFDAVCAETGQLVGAGAVNLSHYTPDGFNVTMASWSLNDAHVPVGTRFPITPDTIGGKIVRTRAPVRIDSWEGRESELAQLVRAYGYSSSVGAPIIVEGQLWGALVAATAADQPLPAETEPRLARFTELVGTAISNATTRSELIASRARIVAAGDEARRRIERNLHDGTQQRLIALGLDLQRIRAALPDDRAEAEAGLDRMRDDLESVLEDVRDLSRGLHPPLLSRGGLRPSLRALARSSPIPLELEVDLPERPPAAIETAAYYVVSEALTNAIRHSGAASISIKIAVDHAGSPFGMGLDGSGRVVYLRATIVDDGVGGAEPGKGSGLMGLVDRVDAQGGRFALESPPGQGTRISIELPLDSVGV